MYSVLTGRAFNDQVDNGFFWRDEAGRMQAGLLDWYNCGVLPFAAVPQGCLSGAAPAMLAQHEHALMPGGNKRRLLAAALRPLGRDKHTSLRPSHSP